MKSFKEYIKPIDITLLESRITQKDFIKAVNSYSNIDDALANLPEEYTEFYLKNINDKKLHKELKKLKLVENYDWEQNQYNLGTAPKPKTVKKIRYKGQYIILQFDVEKGGWIPYFSFRSITNALKFIRGFGDDYL